jgi:hypothetical protein
MKRRTYLAGIIAVCATIVISAGLLAQENPFEQMSPEEQAMMKAWMEYATPGEHHQKLAQRVGEWTLDGKMWNEPGSEAEPFEGTSKIKPIMGGRYFIEEIEGPGFMGMPFEAFSVFGYDNLTKTYFTVFFDNMMTGVSRYEGTPSGDGKTIHYTADVPDVMSGQYKKVRATDTMLNKGHFVFTMYDTTPDGDEFKAMEIQVTRKGASPTSKPMEQMKKKKG